MELPPLFPLQTSIFRRQSQGDLLGICGLKIEFVRFIMQETLVAFQGEAGAFSELAARDFFGDETATLPCQAFEDVFAAVEDERKS